MLGACGGTQLGGEADGAPRGEPDRMRERGEVERVQISWELGGSFLLASANLFSRVSSVGGRTEGTQGNERRGKNSDAGVSQTWHTCQVHLGEAPTQLPKPHLTHLENETHHYLV